MLHTRTSIELDDEVLRYLHPALYKVLRYLVNRADGRGVCFPGDMKIAAGTGFGIRHIERLVPELAETGLIAYVRRGAFDPDTRMRLPNIYVINPAYIAIAPNKESEALRYWEAAAGRNSSIRLLSRVNQHQETNDSNQYHETNASETNTSNPYHAPTPVGAKAPLTTKDKGKNGSAQEPEANDETAEQETQDGNPQHTRRAASNHKKAGGSAAPLKNPAAIDRALPDNDDERMARKLHGLGIRLKLARGFVNDYGREQCSDALAQTFAATETTKIKSLGGFFRTILQENLQNAPKKADDLNQEVGY